MPSTLNLRVTSHFVSQPDVGYAWISSPGAGALSVLFLKVRPDQHDFVLPPDGSPQLYWVVDSQGARIDQVMVARERGGVLVTCHGGHGVRNAITRELSQSGWRELIPGELPLFNARTCFERTLLRLLPYIRGRRAVAMALEALRQTDALKRALASPDGLNVLLDATTDVRFLTTPPRVQLWGVVNAGKSSLLNALCGRELGVVGDEPGLTRDIIEGRLGHDGFEFRLFDAPGLWRESRGVDREAQSLAGKWREQADLTIELVPPGETATLKDAWVCHSRADERADAHPDAVSIRDPDSLTRLKDRLVKHFFGAIINLPPEQRFALAPDLRADLRATANGELDVAEAGKRWFGADA